jgi:diaminopimelate epimerase
MTKRAFVKMHGLGNDFVFFDATKKALRLTPQKVRFISDRHFGVGADQVLILEKSRRADFRMKIYDSDGSEVEMCGNGLRCLAKMVRDKKLSSKKELKLETKAGIQTARFIGKDKVCVNMGVPILKGKEIPVKLNGRVINRPVRLSGSRQVRMTCVSMGNPHCVIFVDDVKNCAVTDLGPHIEKHAFFPKRTNVEFVQVINKRRVKVRTWERGTGETLACGSGACAVAVAGSLNHFTERKVTVELLGGSLEIFWDVKDDCVYMTGPAESVFEGFIDV